MRTTKILLILLILPAIAFAEDEYSIRFERPQKAGDKTWIEGDTAETTVIQIYSDGQLSKNEHEDYKIHLAGVQTVLLVDTDERPTKISIKVDECHKTEGGLQRTLLKKGDELVGWREKGKLVLHVNGAAVDKEMHESLKSFVSVSGEDTSDDDEVFGPGKKVKVGDQWPINSAAAVESLKEEELEATAENVIGTIKLESVRPRSGIPCQEVTGSFRIKHLQFPHPEGMKADNSEVNVNLKTFLPLDETLPAVQEEGSMELNMVASGRVSDKGKTVQMKMLVRAKQNSSIRRKKMN